MKPSEGFGTIAPVITPDESVSEHKQGDLIGYARVSTDEQSLDLQFDALKAAGCDRVYQDDGSGTLADRPELALTLDHVRAGDTLVVWKLDRLGRSTHHLIGLVQELDRRDVALRSSTAR